MGLWSGLDYNPFWYPRTWKMNIICILFVYYPHIYCLLVAYCLKFLIKQAYYPHIIWILSADWEMCLPNASPLLPLQPQYEIISQNPAVAQRYLENREVGYLKTDNNHPLGAVRGQNLELFCYQITVAAEV